MSKSVGNVISPYDMVDRYGTDATRYILLRHVHPTEDSDLTWEKMDGHYTDHLVNGLGNLVARILKMAETHLPGPVTLPASSADIQTGLDALATYDFQRVCDELWHKMNRLDERITTTEPFKLVKTDAPAAQQIITELVLELSELAHLLQPFLPQTASIIKQAIARNEKPENLFARLAR